eukprot:scpid95456/ scgid11251/ Tigger transposable element-derived protein 4
MAQKRKRFSIAEKFGILQDLDTGAKRKDVEEKHGISHGTLAGFIRDRERIANASAKSTAQGFQSKLSIRQPRFCEVESIVLEWLQQEASLAPKKVLSGPDLQAKAQYIFRALVSRGIDLYKDEDVEKLDLSWIQRFRKRYGISGKASVDESPAASATACKSRGKKETPIEQIEKEFHKNDIFNICKTGVEWRMTPETAFLDGRRKNADVVGERLVVLVSASAVGEKLPLFIVGNCNLPNCCEGDV